MFSVFQSLNPDHQRNYCLCRVAAKIDQNRRPTLTKVRCVAGARQSALHGSMVNAVAAPLDRVHRSQTRPRRRTACPAISCSGLNPSSGHCLTPRPRRKDPPRRQRHGTPACRCPAVPTRARPRPRLQPTHGCHRHRWTAARHRQGFLVETREVVPCRRSRRGEATARLAAG